MMKYIRVFSRLILGIVFIFSGFVKAVDPLGSAYKFSDYFTAFRLDFLEFIALPLGILLSAFEMVLGIALLLGYRRRIVYWINMWFMSFFTLLTLVLAIFNPVSDCGCFGDALILTNWETFLKNVVLMVFVLILYLNRKKEKDEGGVITEWAVVAAIYILGAWFSIWNYNHLPLLDFRPYQVGTVIAEEMEIPEGAPQDQYETKLIYRNRESGEESEFTMDDYPRDTLQWEFVTSESKLIKKGFEPPIHDFAIMDHDGFDMVDQLLADEGYSLLMIAYDLTRADEEVLQSARDWSQIELLADDFNFYAVSASTTEEVESKASELDLGYPFYVADEIMLKTIVRANPGFVLIRNGTIIGKWGQDFPTVESMNPEWHELIGNAAVPMDEEAQLLREAGVYEDFSFSVIRFDSFMPGLILTENMQKREHGIVIAFIMGIVILLLVSQYLSPTKT
jgi:uncharacterized membrane protein YphA (DoxX/SURF4 family)